MAQQNQPNVNVIISATSQVAATLQRIQQEVVQAGAAIQQTIGAAFNASGASAAFKSLDAEALQLAKLVGGIKFPDFNVEENPIVQTFERIRGLATNNEVLKTVFAFNELAEAGHVVEAAFRPVFEGLIAQNIELRQQILSTAATLAQSQTLKIGSTEVTDPVAKIKAQSEEVTKQLNVLRRDALELAGVTSTELVSSFQTLAQQSATLGLNLQQAEKTTIALTAASTTLGLTGQQREQEIQGIARGEITVYNQLAKSLGINNEIIKQKAAEGRLYQFIQDKTEALRKAQSLAADGFSGLTSNIEEIAQLLSQLAGAPLLDGLLTVIREVYKTLKDNYDGLEQLTKGVADFFTQVGQQIEGIAKTLAPALQPFAQAVGEVLLTSLQTFGGLLTDTLAIVQALATGFAPLLEALGNLTKLAADFVSSPFGQTFVQISVETGIAALALGKLAVAFYEVRAAIIAAGGAQAAFAAFQAGTFATSVGGAAVKVLTLGNALKGIASFAPLGAALTGVGTAISGVAGAAATGTLTVGTFTAALAPLAAAAALVALPFVALGSAIAAVSVAKASKDLQNYTEAADNASVATNDLADRSLKTAVSLKALNSVEKERGTLTATQTLQRDRLIKLAQQEQKGIDDQIAGLKKQKQDFGDQNGLLDQQIALLEKRKELLGNQIPIKTENVPVEDKGSETLQLLDRIAAKKKELENPKDQVKLIEASKDTIESTKRLLELGVISRDDAVKTFTNIANLRGQDAKVAQEAQKAISDAEKVELERRSEDVKANLAETEAAVASGRLGEVEGAEAVTAKKKELLDLELENLKAEKEAEDALREKSTQHNLDLVNKQILEARDALGKAQQSGDKDSITAAEQDLKAANTKKQSILDAGHAAQLEADRKFGNQQKELSAKRETEEIEGQRRIQAARITVIDRQAKRAEDEVAQSRLDRELQLDQQFQKGAVSREQIRQRENKGKLDDIQAELSAERVKQSQLEALPKSNNPVDEEKRESLIRASKQKTTKLAIDLINEEIAQRKRAIDDQLQAQKNLLVAQELPLQRQVDLGGLYVKSLETQQRLLSAKSEILKSINEYQQGEYALAIKLAGVQDTRRERELQRRDAELKFLTATTDEEAQQAKQDLDRLDAEERQRQLQIEAAKAKLEALEKEQELERESAALEAEKTVELQKQEELKLKIAAIDAKIATADAVGEAAKLKADPKATQTQIDSANEKVQSSKQKEALIQDEQKLQADVRASNEAQAESKRRTLANKQALERDEARGDLATLDPSGQAARQQSFEAQGKARNAQIDSPGTRNGNERQAIQPPSPLSQNAATSITNNLAIDTKQQVELLAQIRDGIEAQKRGGQPANATINNYFTGNADRVAVQDASQQTLTTLKRVLNLAGATGS
ncbi:MAG: hypothetical protein ACAF41_12550 [Leptolyngbya sp. BL-A-14]